MIKNMYLQMIYLVVMLVSCSENEEKLEKTFQVNASFSFTQTQVWPTKYQIVAGAFGVDTLNPLVYKVLNNPGDHVETLVSLEKTPESATNIKLYIANMAGQPVCILSNQLIAAPSSILDLNNVEINMLTYSRIQKQVFSTCIVCHGGSSGNAAAGLNILPTNSYANLVGVTASNANKKRVVAGNISESFLIDVMRKKQTAFSHSASNTIEEEDIVLVEKWIVNGALNN